MKNRLNKILVFTVLVTTIAMFYSEQAEASACKDGRYIYYAYEMSGVRMGIMRYDTKTQKKKEIVDYHYNKKETNGFDDINISGNYIYATWDQAYGTSGSYHYIYRFSKSGKTKKKLAKGSIYAVCNGYIYYYPEKEVTYGSGDYAETFTERTGYLYKMKLDGSSKKKVIKLSEVGWYGFDNKGQFVYANSVSDEYVYTEQGKKIKRNSSEPSGKYMYVTDKKSSDELYYKKIYRENLKTGKKTLIASFSSGIVEWQLCGDYLMVVAYTGSYENLDCKLNVYCISTDGKSKKKLATWVPGE